MPQAMFQTKQRSEHVVLEKDNLCEMKSCERNLLSVLDTLPKHILHTPPSWFDKLISSDGEMATVALLPTFGIAGLGLFLNNPTLILSSIIWQIFVLVSFTHIRKKIRFPNIEPSSVKSRKNLLVNYAQRLPSRELKKRLTDLYMVCDSSSINGRFWEDLEIALKKYDEEDCLSNDKRVLEIKQGLEEKGL